MTDPEFMVRHRCSPQNFIRRRILSFSVLICFLLNFRKHSTQTELDRFFQTVNGGELPIHTVSKSAVTKARSKLRHQAFIELNHHLVDRFYENAPGRSWNGFRLLAIDGTTLQLPSLPGLLDHFEGMPSLNKTRPLARASQLYDVRNKITLDAVLGPYSRGERESALSHFSFLTSNDLLLLDRGYGAFWFLVAISSRQAHFCARITTSQWSCVKKFYRSGKPEAVITLAPPKRSRQKCQELGLSTEHITVRLLRIESDSGETEILVTSLLDSESFPWSCFSSLYHERWGIEENYKTMKCRLQVENFSGKSVESIYQDFHAKVLAMNLTAALVFPAQEIVTQESRRLQQNGSNKYLHQVNFTQALSCMKHTIVHLFMRKNPISFLSDLFDLFIRNTASIRPGRRFSRKRAVRDHPVFFTSYLDPA